MKVFIKVISIVWLLLILVNAALAQVDPSAALLLRKSSNPSDDYTSSRYKVKPKVEAETPTTNKNSMSIRVPQKFEEEEKPEVVAEQPLPTMEKINSPSEIETVKSPVEAPKEVIIDSDLTLEKYRSLLHPLDRRRNMIDFSIGPSYFYQNSSSRFWTRDYYSSNLGLDSNLKMWLSPYFGLQASYLTSLNAELKSSPQGTEFLEVEHNWFTAGLRFRNFYGLSRKAKSLTFGLDFYEYQFDVPATATQRVGLLSKGVMVSLEADLPNTNARSWFMGFELMPMLSHDEVKKLGDVQTGNKNNSSAMGFWLGKKIKFDRKSEIYWKIHHRIEKNNFSGQTESIDPILQSKIKGNSVTDSTTFFHLGFTWGR
ncbi:MAG: hypothetical protein H6625_04890 [Bdellovibrionaceae bacterium]|nr:hypothetical protein [Pseudobdellovibrionaceae bacterium]